MKGFGCMASSRLNAGISLHLNLPPIAAGVFMKDAVNSRAAYALVMKDDGCIQLP